MQTLSQQDFVEYLNPPKYNWNNILRHLNQWTHFEGICWGEQKIKEKKKKKLWKKANWTFARSKVENYLCDFDNLHTDLFAD